MDHKLEDAMDVIFEHTEQQRREAQIRIADKMRQIFSKDEDSKTRAKELELKMRKMFRRRGLEWNAQTLEAALFGISFGKTGGDEDEDTQMIGEGVMIMFAEDQRDLEASQK